MFDIALLKETLPYLERAAELKTHDGYCQYCGHMGRHYGNCESYAIQNLINRIKARIEATTPLYKTVGDKQTINLEHTIENETQYAVTKAQLAKFEYELTAAPNELQERAFLSVVEELQLQILEYENRLSKQK